MESGLNLSSRPASITNVSKEPGLSRRQALTISLLFLGYAGCYLCRSHLSVTMPLIVNELASRGISPNEAKIHMGRIISLGVFAYALGKFVFAGTADFLGGRRNFLTGMGGAVVFTLVFALGGSLPIFTMAWIGNRLLQSISWAGLVKVSSRWFSYKSYGVVMATLSLSLSSGLIDTVGYLGAILAGETVARISVSYGWPTAFGCLGLVTVLAAIASALLWFLLRHKGKPQNPK